MSFGCVLIKSFLYQTFPVYTNIRNLEVVYIFMSLLTKYKREVLVTRLNLCCIENSPFTTHEWIVYIFSFCWETEDLRTGSWVRIMEHMKKVTCQDLNINVEIISKIKHSIFSKYYIKQSRYCDFTRTKSLENIRSVFQMLFLKWLI